MFWLNASVFIRVKVSENFNIYNRTLVRICHWVSLEVKGRWWLLLPSYFLINALKQPGISSPLSQLKHSSAGVFCIHRAPFSTSCSFPCPLALSSTDRRRSNLELPSSYTALRDHWQSLILSPWFLPPHPIKASLSWGFSFKESPHPSTMCRCLTADK